MPKNLRLSRLGLLLLQMLYLSGCTFDLIDEPELVSSSSVGGMVTGLAGSVVLQNNGGDDLTIGVDGVFDFPTSIAEGETFNVTVLTQPAGQICTVTNGAGTVAAADVTDIGVDCATNFAIGGVASGLTGGVVLQNNGDESLTVGVNGAFSFLTALDDGDAYSVTVLTQPAGQICTVTNASGTVAGADVLNVGVDCVTFASVGGSVSGLTGSVVLQNSGGDDLTLAANGSFTFATELVEGAAYAVTVRTQPASQICTVTNASGTVSAAGITNVGVSCVTFSSVGGSVSGLTGGVVLQNNGGDDLTLGANGAFTFSTSLFSGAVYSVTVRTQPAGQICTVTNGSGTASGTNISNVGVSCVTFSSVGGSVSGLTGSVVLQNNGGNNLTIGANGAFTFSTALAEGAAYSVTVLTQPANQICSVTNGAGTLAGTNITNVGVSCVTFSSVGGTVSGLTGSVVLQNNGGNNLTVGANGPFTFSTALAEGATYSVTVLTQPAGQECTVTNGAGSVAGADVTNVGVSCVTFSSVGGSVSGLTGSVVLQNNAGDDLTLAADGVFAFATELAEGTPYAVTILTQPEGQTCTLTNASGTLAAADVTNVGVDCVTFSSIGGSVSGLTGSVVLQNDAGDDLTVAANGAFTFATELAEGETYAVTVSTQPAGQTCTVTNGTGTLAAADVTNVGVDCVTFSSIGGSVSGLTGSVVLQNNGGDDLTLAAGGAFTFATELAEGAAYAISILTQPVGQTCSVTNGAGTLAAVDVTNVAVSCENDFSSIGGSVSGLSGSVVLQNSGGDDLTIGSNGAFTFSSSIANGASYEVTVLTQPAGQECTVTDGTGSAAGADVTNITVNCVSAAFYVYVTDVSNNEVTTFAISSTTGSPTKVGSAVATGDIPLSATVDPTGRFAYVANGATNDVTIFSIDSTTGSLTKVGSEVAAGSLPFSVAVDPTGQFAYVVNTGSNDVTTYSINAADGSLTEVGSEVAAGNEPKGLTVDPTGRFVYVANQTSADVTTFSIDATDGSLTEVGSEVAAGSVPVFMTVDPTGRFAYVANSGSDDVTTYSIDATDGSLTEVGSEVAAGSVPVAVTVDPTGRFAYVANSGSDDVTTFSINSTTGSLTEVGTEASAGDQPRSVTVDPTGRFAYVANLISEDLTTFSINPTDGSLTKVGSEVAVGPGAYSVTVTPPRRFAYVANSTSDDVTTFSIDATDGSLTKVGSEVAAGTDPRSVTVDPTGRFAYVANWGSNDVTTFSINATDGSLTEVGSEVSTGVAPESVTVDPTGRFAYVANWWRGDVTTFSIDAADGSLTEVGSEVAAGNGPESVTVDPAGRFAYVANWLSNDVTTFSIDATDGSLTEVGSEVSVGCSPTSVVVDPTGRFAYVSCEGGSELRAFSIDATDGSLTEVGSGFLGGGADALSVTVDPTGRFVYTTNEFGADLSIYEINATNGSVTYVGSESTAGVGPASISIDPTGRFAYVVNTTSNNVTTYAIDPVDGSLTEVGSEVAAGSGPLSITVLGGTR